MKPQQINHEPPLKVAEGIQGLNDNRDRLVAHLKYRGCSDADIDDILQEVAVKLINEARSDREIRCVFAWSKATAVRLAIDLKRRGWGARRADCDVCCNSADFKDGKWYGMYLLGHLLGRLNHEIQLLSQDEAEAIRAWYCAGGTQADVASSLGIPLATLRARLKRAIGKLQQGMADKEDDFMTLLKFQD